MTLQNAPQGDANTFDKCAGGTEGSDPEAITAGIEGENIASTPGSMKDYNGRLTIPSFQSEKTIFHDGVKSNPCRL